MLQLGCPASYLQPQPHTQNHTLNISILEWARGHQASCNQMLCLAHKTHSSVLMLSCTFGCKAWQFSFLKGDTHTATRMLLNSDFSLLSHSTILSVRMLLSEQIRFCNLAALLHTQSHTQPHTTTHTHSHSHTHIQTHTLEYTYTQKQIRVSIFK